MTDSLKQLSPERLPPDLRAALSHKLTALGDDELLLAHRNSEWTGHAPILEEDIALANLAQDELGHAGLWYGLLQELSGDNPDRLVYFRSAPQYRNAQLLELPRGDWALTMLRQYLFDAYEHVYLAALGDSRYTPLTDVTDKMRKEELFHLRHSHTWVERLGLGTPESNRRLQTALGTLWPHAQQLFIPLPDEHVLVEAGILPELRSLKPAWLRHVSLHLQECKLTLPQERGGVTSRAEHTPHLVQLLENLQGVARLEPGGNW